MKTILVTGATGFIGKSLLYHLTAQGFDAVSLCSSEFDLTHQEVVQKLYRQRFDYIFHLAAQVGVTDSWIRPQDYYTKNYLSTLHILEYARINNIPVHYVSTYTYGHQRNQPVSEENLLKPQHPYTHSKWLAEELCLFYCTYFNVSLTISRPFNIYGPLQPSEYFISNIINQIINDPTILINDPMFKRDYIHVDNVCEALIAIMHQGKNGEIYNIGMGLSYSCKEVIDLLQLILNTSKKIVSNGVNPHNEVEDARANIIKIQKDTNWKPRYSLKEGLSRTLFSLGYNISTSSYMI